MALPIKVRSAQVADIPRILEIERSAATAAHWSEAEYQKVLDRGRAGPERLALVAELVAEDVAEDGAQDAGRVVGFLVTRHVAPEWELENLVVALKHRRKGVGGRLLDTWLTSSMHTDSREVFLEVRASNLAARKLYERVGFIEAGSRPRYYRDPAEDAVVYRKTLP
jgi:[ribosomal protein S18]-alanine N-acetyltransferase